MNSSLERSLVAFVLRMTWTVWLLAKSHIRDHPMRVCLTILGVGLGVAAPVAIDSANRHVVRSFSASVVEVAGSATIEIAAGEEEFSEVLVQQARADPQVRIALPILEHRVRDVASGHLVSVIGTDLLDLARVKQLREGVPGGDDLRATLLGGGVLIGRQLAETWRATVGDSRSMDAGSGARDMRIAAILSPEHEASSVWDSMALMDIAAAQEWFDRVGVLSRIDVVIEPGADVETVIHRLRHRLPFGVTVQRPARRGEQVEAMVSAFRLNLLMLSAVGLLVGAFLIYNTLSFSVVQRRREIGILRAIGCSTRGIYALFLCEGLLGGLLGGWLGGWFGLALSHALVDIVSRNITELYVSVESSAGTWRIGDGANAVLAQGVVLGTFMSLLGALMPSLEASRTHVVGALAIGGYELRTQGHVARWAGAGLVLLGLSLGLAMLPPQGERPLSGYAAVFCLLLGLTAVTPWVVQRLAPRRQRLVGRQSTGAGNVSLAGLAALAAARAPHRNGVTVSTLLIGLAIIVGVVVMIQSFRQTVERWIDQTVVADIILSADGWLRGVSEGAVTRTMPSAWSTLIAEVPGVAAVDSYREVKLELAGRSRSLVARDLRLHAERSRYWFVRGDSRAILREAASERGVVVSEVLAGAVGVSVGDELLLTTPSGPNAYPVVGIFYDYATDGGKVVMDRALFQEAWGDVGVTVIPIYLAPGAEAQHVGRAVVERIRLAEGRDPRLALIQNGELRREILAIFDRTFRVTYVLEFIVLVIAMFGMVNTLLTAALERRRELATLLALGASEGQLTRLLLWEAGYLGGLGGVLGIMGGVWLGGLLVWVINKQSFGWTIQFLVPPHVLVLAFVGAVGTALAAAYWPAKWIARQPAVEGLRYE